MKWFIYFFHVFSGSIINVGGLVGCLFSPPLMVWMGQRILILTMLPISLCTWILQGTCTRISILILARFILGMVAGISNDACASYIIECAQTRIRGQLVSVMDLSRQIGYLFVYVIGSTNLNWRELSYVCGAVTTIIPFIGLLFMPSSPRWLAVTNRHEECKKSLTFFRGEKHDIKTEFDSIVCQLEQEKSSRTTLDQFKILFSMPIVKPFLIMSFIMFIIDFNGNLTSISYTVTIFQSSKSGINAYFSTVLIGITRILGVISYSFIGNRYDRKTVFVFCFSGGSIFILIVGIHFYLDHLDLISDKFYWLPLCSMIFYVFMMGLVQPVLSMIRSEILPNSVRSVGVGLLVLMLYSGGFLVIQVYPLMVNEIGIYGVFWSYSAVGIIIIIILKLGIPETKGKTLEELSCSMSC